MKQGRLKSILNVLLFFPIAWLADQNFFEKLGIIPM